MKILVTGGMGHIGSKLVDKLTNDKKIKKILIIDNFSNNKENTILFLKNRKKIIFINQDLIKYRPKKKNQSRLCYSSCIKHERRKKF